MMSDASLKPPSVNMRAPGDSGVGRLQFWIVVGGGDGSGAAVRHGKVWLDVPVVPFDATMTGAEDVGLVKPSLINVAAVAGGGHKRAPLRSAVNPKRTASLGTRRCDLVRIRRGPPLRACAGGRKPV